MAKQAKQLIPGVVKCTERPHGTVGLGTRQKPLYRFHPDTKDMPPMVVPYKPNVKSFSKAKRDLFAVVECVAEPCVPSTTPLRSTLHQVFGHVGDYKAYVAYQLSRHGIAPSIARFTKNMKRAIRDNMCGGVDTMMEDRTDRYVITVDPAGCMDADDAMGAVAWEDGESVLGTIISTYITHVPHTLERLGAWENFSPTVPFRVATTYLPNNNNLPMLPRILSEGECSLMDGNVCSCLAMDQYVTPEGKVARVEFVECVVRITENYAYESPEMLSDPVYRMIGDLVRRINELGGMRLVDAVNDSHDVVEWLMLRMNCEAGKRLYEAKRGIFRSVVVGAGESTIPPHIARKARKFMAQYRNTTASYELAEDDRGHGLVGDGGDGALITHYAQITSPIRHEAPRTTLSC